ncbi:O-antigen ligase family protein [Candidatus Stoquefichus massiliensis]|uniref:O-antigen ligase family protein n=1 Tax=Candidatus Stoquefichus massiliensis TaxID=1470350 RepID=UPI0004883C78|nr:O-antigen ligase family protein [Candidatus Stoquefichus massiliensis]
MGLIYKKVYSDILKIDSKKIFNIILLLIFLRPHFSNLTSVVSTYLIDLIIIGLLMITSFKNRNGKIKINENLSRYFLLMLMLIIPMLFNIFFIGGDFVGIIDYVKIVYYIIVYICLVNLLAKIDYSEEEIIRMIQKYFYINVCIALIQLFSIPVISNVVHFFFGQDKLRDLYSGYSRVYATFYNANWFGVYLIFYFSIINSLFFKNKIIIFKYLINVFLLAIMLIISGSRTSMIGALICFTIQLFLNMKIKNILKFFAFFVPIVIVVVWGANQVDYLAKTIGRFTTFYDSILGNGSFTIKNLANSRYDSWMQTIELIKTSPIVGRIDSNIIPHNTYLLFMLDFGLFGFLTFVVSSLVSAYNYMLKRKVYKNVFFTSICGFAPSFCIVCMSGDYFFSTQVMIMIVFLIVLDDVFMMKNRLVEKRENI